nr:glycosyl hydrolase [Chitinophagales bacterium]
MKLISITFIVLWLGLFFSGFSQTAPISSATFGSIEARQIGPAVMGGRITAIDAVNTDPRTIYVGSAAGGIWKTTTAGTFFKPIFDKYTQSIGDLKIDQAHPDTIWVGTGESNMRNSVSVGDGLYVTYDGGSNWKKAGLDSTEHISKIVINPKNSSIIYVAAPGPLWNDSKSRGLYKSTDCGNTWEKILYTDDKTGCADVAIDPSNPDIVYASMWQFRRTPWSFASGGPGSALYKSIDGGKNWKKIQNGFNQGDLGRIVIAIAPSAPQQVYAIVEAEKSALYLSDNGGETWKQQSTTRNVTARPFYFSVFSIDPYDAKRVYRPAFTLSISDDGGYSFKEASFAGGWVHSDHHALWINPNNTSHLYLGTDGGVYMSMDRGNNWIFLNNLPLSQYYHVAIDGADPYNVYGGLQDNGSWMGPSASPGGITNEDWRPLGFGDGFWVQPDKKFPDYIYWEYQGGNIYRLNKTTNEQKNIAPYPLAGEAKLRWNWNSPLYLSPSNKLYTGSQYLYVTPNQGDTWSKISPDLTTNNPDKQKQEESGGVTIDNSSAENHCTIFTVAESPLDPDQLWVGTDDGNLQLSLDAGKNWDNVIKNISGLPANTWVSSIEPSSYDKMICYVSFEGHATGDMTPYIYKTADGGKTWNRLNQEGLKGFVHKVKEDVINSNLLFVGTEKGLFVSIDGGNTWAQM